MAAPAISPVLAPPPPPPSSSRLQGGTAAMIKISPIVTKWYTKRPYQSFEVHMIDPASGGTFVHTQNWQIAVRLISGHGLYVDHLLTAPSLIFPVTEGKAVVSGIKFSAVSSRNGGYFQFEVSVRHPTDCGVTAIRSPELRILSERLKNESKAASVLELNASDSLVRVPGIGKKYAARLAEVGLKTVRDLALVQTENTPASRKRRAELMETARKDRGTLTEAKLADMLRDAQKVVQRDDYGLPFQPADQQKLLVQQQQLQMQQQHQQQYQQHQQEQQQQQHQQFVFGDVATAAAAAAAAASTYDGQEYSAAKRQRHSSSLAFNNNNNNQVSAEENDSTSLEEQLFEFDVNSMINPGFLGELVPVRN